MSLHDEIARVAYDLYEKGGRTDGRDSENWLEAEKIVLARNAERAKSNEGKRAETAKPRPRQPAGAKTKSAKI